MVHNWRIISYFFRTTRTIQPHVPYMKLDPTFFARPPQQLARDLLGKVLRRKLGNFWLSARIIETEAYEMSERASHSSLGWTMSRRAMFMSPGTIYMYHARGKPSLNFSALGEGNAVLVKSAVPVVDELSGPDSLACMLERNPIGNRQRDVHKLCSGQTLVCQSLGLSVENWNGKLLCDEFYLEDDQYQPTTVLRCKRLGIPPGRDEHLLYRFLLEPFAKSCTNNPLTSRSLRYGKDYVRETVI